MKLLIVESPSKAKTIEKFLDKSYVVRASIGHVRDLPKSNKNAIDIPAGFVPKYEISRGKEKVVNELKNLSEKAEEIILATDPDREGEAISWHLKELLENKKNKAAFKRAAFNEITKEAVLLSLNNTRDIDLNLVKAQEARRVLDRLVGYDLSGIVWKKIRYGLSAGRVQSPAMRIIMEREREIRSFIPEKFWSIEATLETPKKEKIKMTCSEEPRDKKTVESIIEKGKNENWKIIEIKSSQQKRQPKPPFTTSSLQQSASSRLGFSPSKTMMLAQKLYEAGHITYMRTDSTNLSVIFQNQTSRFIEKKYGAEFAFPRFYKTKSKNAQEAHEAIRPTQVQKVQAGNTEDQKKLYQLIWTRTISSQMSDAKLLKTKITANTITESLPNFTANGSIVEFEGWLLCDTSAKGEDIELPKVKKEEALKLLEMSDEEKETQPPNRYTEAGLIKELENRGIGRPSTYATIMKTIEDRGYVTREGRTLFPSDTGEAVSSFLEDNFANYISDSFTSNLEDQLDDISSGKRNYTKTLKDFYTPFSLEIKKKEKLEKATNFGEAPDEIKCPVCEGKMVIKLARNGKFYSCVKFPDCQGARTLEGKELEGPKETGEECPLCGEKKGGKLVQREGRYGSFVSCSNYPKCKFIKKDEEEEAKKKTGVKCPDCKDGEITERRGRFGIFYSCSNYPNCKFAMKAKPTGKICSLCKSLMMEGTKTIPERCSNTKCPNYRPDKLSKGKK